MTAKRDQVEPHVRAAGAAGDDRMVSLAVPRPDAAHFATTGAAKLVEGRSAVDPHFFLRCFFACGQVAKCALYLGPVQIGSNIPPRLICTLPSAITMLPSGLGSASSGISAPVAAVFPQRIG